MAKERNAFVDIMRGVAMLLVVLGHTMTGSTVNSEKTFAFGIVWSLQMPLFILISGYVTRYSRGIENGVGLLRYIGRRTLAYMLPWAVWSFLIRGLIFGQRKYLDVKYMLWHTDSGYWFLITIWMISIVFGIASYISSAAKKSAATKNAIIIAAFVAGMAVYAGVGNFAGMTFLGIKLTLYYMPFYLAGWLYGQYRDKIFALSAGKTAVDIVIAACLLAWIFCIRRFDLYAMSDGGINIIIRACVSLCGCIAVCGLLKGLFELPGKPNAAGRLFDWCGVHSLEIYMLHGFVLNILRLKTKPEFSSITGYALVFGNYVIAIILCFVIISIISQSKILKKPLGIK
ncbi:MAG: acyltransferase [Clostridia bacterium]|nr:acyltransferase [Clostridia bacterium]